MDRKVLVAFAAMCVLSHVKANGDAIDRDSLACYLSDLISEMAILDDGKLDVRIMERPENLELFDLRENPEMKFSGARRISGNEHVRMEPGDAFNYSQSCRDGTDVSIFYTNATVLAGCERRPESFGDLTGAVLLVRKCHWGDRHTNSKSTYRNYIIDVKGERFYDIEKNVVGEFKMPFHSLWKDWDDYEDNFSLVEGRDIKAECKRISQGLLEETRSCKPLADFAQTLTNGEIRVVLYRNEGGEPSLTPIRLQKHGDGFILLSGGWFFENGAQAVCVFDDNRRVRWYYDYFGDREYVYEFDERGEFSRFAEIDEKGGELRRRYRNLKDGVMLGEPERSVFVEEVRNAVRPLAKALHDKTFTSVYKKPQPRKPTPEEEREDAAMRENIARHERMRQEKYEKINAERLAKGMPELTEVDKRRIEHTEFLDHSQKEFEQLRTIIYGSMETNEVNSQITLELARLLTLFYAANFTYPGMFNKKKPKSLDDLISAKKSNSDSQLLLDGESYRQDMWGRPYRYRIGQGLHWRLKQECAIITSAGPDGVFDTEDDLSSEDYFRLRLRAAKIDAAQKKK